MSSIKNPRQKLKVGLVVNPLAGIGGAVALKGSDGVAEEAIRRGGVSHVAERVNLVLDQLDQTAAHWFTVAGAMGSDLLDENGYEYKLVSHKPSAQTTSEDTIKVVGELAGVGVDLLVFAGGDGTARNVTDACGAIPAVLGIPCGVKMHSGVFATSPSAAAAILVKFLRGEMLSVVHGEVRDIDEQALREGRVRSSFYGTLPVPHDLRYIQQTKFGGKEDEALVQVEIAAGISEAMAADCLYFMGAGTTVASVMENLSLENTLLGVDVVLNGAVIQADATEPQLWALLQEHCTAKIASKIASKIAVKKAAKIVVSVIGSQGFLFGRGNQQFSPRVIEKVGRNNVIALASKTKLAELGGRPLLVDTGSLALDEALSGVMRITTGYEDEVYYRVGYEPV